MRNGKILCVVETLGQGGGAEKLISDIAPIISQKKIPIEIVALFDWHPNYVSALNHGGIRVHELHINNKSNFFIKLFRLYFFLKKNPHTIIWSHLFLPNTLTGLLRFFRLCGPVINTFHSYGYTVRKSNIFLSALLKLSIQSADKKIAVSSAAANYLSQKFSCTVDFICNGADIQTLKKSGPFNKQQLPEKFLLVPARLVEEKGHLILLAAMEMLIKQGSVVPPLVFYGEGYLRKQIEQRAKSIKANLILLNSLSFADVSGLMQKATLIALPSLREGFGLSLVESLALEKKVLASKIPAFQEIVGGSSCVTWAMPNDINSWAEAIKKNWPNPTHPKTEAKILAIEMEKRFSIEKCANEWQLLLEKFSKEIQGSR